MPRPPAIPTGSHQIRNLFHSFPSVSRVFSLPQFSYLVPIRVPHVSPFSINFPLSHAFSPVLLFRFAVYFR